MIQAGFLLSIIPAGGGPMNFSVTLWQAVHFRSYIVLPLAARTLSIEEESSTSVIGPIPMFAIGLSAFPSIEPVFVVLVSDPFSDPEQAIRNKKVILMIEFLFNLIFDVSL
jgi:hypothetical protein